MEAFHEGFSPRGSSERSWLGFVARMRGLNPLRQLRSNDRTPFSSNWKKTEASRSYKLVLLLAMLAADALPGSIAIEALTEHVARIAIRFAKLKDDFSVDLDDKKRLERLLIENPIYAFVEAKGTAGVNYFRVDGDLFATTFAVEQREEFKDLTREILDRRIAQYLSRSDGLTGDVICRVARAGDRPILFLPRPAESLGLGRGPTTVAVNGDEFEAVIAKIAINVLHRRGSESNELPEILRKWFGPDAGLPGRGERVNLKRSGDRLSLEPLRAAQQAGALDRWNRYLREKIPPGFGLKFSQAIWNAGFVTQDPDIFLLVTLSKDGMTSDHRYIDHFISDKEFAWQSQNRTTRASKHGQILCNHQSMGKTVHLFVRPTKKTGSKPTPFVYCGEVDFLSWEGDAPISIRWVLREPVPASSAQRL